MNVLSLLTNACKMKKGKFKTFVFQAEYFS